VLTVQVDGYEQGGAGERSLTVYFYPERRLGRYGSSGRNVPENHVRALHCQRHN